MNDVKNRLICYIEAGIHNLADNKCGVSQMVSNNGMWH